MKDRAMGVVYMLQHFIIGGYTTSHLAFININNKEFRHEVADGITKSQSAIGKPFYHFAYPYEFPNEIGERKHRLISEFNFMTMFTRWRRLHHRKKAPKHPFTKSLFA